MKEVARAIILNGEGKVLLGKRARGVGEGQWSLIGGKPDPGESMVDAVIREVKEETSLKFTPQFYLEMTDDFSVPGEKWRTIFYHGRGEGEIKIKDDEILEAVYAGLAELDNLDIAFNHKEILLDFFKNNI